MKNLKSINLQVYIMLIAIIVIMLFFSFATDGAYLSARNISNLLRQTSITGILAIGMLFVIIAAEIDLSVGSLMGLLGGFAAITNVWWGWPLPTTIFSHIDFRFNLRHLERLLGCISTRTFIHCYPCRITRFPWNFSRDD